MRKSQSQSASALGGAVPTNGADEFIEMQKPYRAEISIEGTTPILFHAWNVEAVEAQQSAKKGSKERKTDNVEPFVYRDESGEICIPGSYIRGALVGAAKFLQDPRSARKSACDLFKAAIIPITRLATLGTKQWDYIDRQRVTIQKNSVTRSRPAFHEGWKVKFVVQVNLPGYVPAKLLHEAVVGAGMFCGIGDFRPTYGQFRVTKFEVLH